jgi:hypothetical protein
VKIGLILPQGFFNEFAGYARATMYEFVEDCRAVGIVL